jgi:hypothetical protein
MATDEDLVDKDQSPDFYINICQPLNPIPGVTCPPGAAVCMDPDDGPPVVSHTQRNACAPQHTHTEEMKTWRLLNSIPSVFMLKQFDSYLFINQFN